MTLSLLWLRRDLRLHDNQALATALQHPHPIQPVFIFDTDILADFPDKNDRRLVFIAESLVKLDRDLKEKGGNLLILHGSAKMLMPQLAKTLNASHIFAARDYEPQTLKRDAAVKDSLKGVAEMILVNDHLIFSPTQIAKEDGSPYKVFTPYSKVWLSNITHHCLTLLSYKDAGRYAQMHLKTINTNDAKTMLAEIGYEYSQDALWNPFQAHTTLDHFIENKAKAYPVMRDKVGEEGTSRISPYLRFGLISIRECVSAAYRVGADVWLSELIWREFYAMILYHYPESVHLEWNPKYRGTLTWQQDEKLFSAWCEGKTGYPIVDAAMRQLVQEGWMHNRSRMIVASFLTKDLQIDWRKGEQHFARYLMDYELASNVGGWQWAASTGTDAQPYFRIFNPTLQSQKCDPAGKYIRKFLPELKGVESEYLHEPSQGGLLAPRYYQPVVNHKEAKEKAIAMFKSNL